MKNFRYVFAGLAAVGLLVVLSSYIQSGPSLSCSDQDVILYLQKTYEEGAYAGMRSTVSIDNIRSINNLENGVSCRAEITYYTPAVGMVATDDAPFTVRLTSDGKTYVSLNSDSSKVLRMRLGTLDDKQRWKERYGSAQPASSNPMMQPLIPEPFRKQPGTR
jgi:hypothetical protein